MKNDALEIISYAFKKADPFDATYNILKKLEISAEKLTVFSIGKAAVPMADAAQAVFGDRIENGLIVTKYRHTGSFSSPYFQVIEAAHPISDRNSVLAAETALETAKKLGENDVCVVLLSGGGSALFEKSLIDEEAQRDITAKLLARGADIEEINAVRRRISAVKGGRFGAAIYPAKVFTIALSDVLSNDKAAIASGITVGDGTPPRQAFAVAEKYIPEYSEMLRDIFFRQSEVTINDAGYYFAGDINTLCDAAKKRAQELGYTAQVVSRSLTGEAADAAERIVNSIPGLPGRRAYIYGGETTVTLKGSGRGGRNQEMVLKAAIELRGKSGVVFASAGSDGTDGPTDAAGGIADGETYCRMTAAGVDPEAELADNNSNYALAAAGSLIVTGPTGTNVNDITLVLKDG